MAEAAVFLLLPSASLCCFLPLFFVLSVNRVSSPSTVDVWPPSCSQWITVAGERHDDSCCSFFFFPVCCLCQQHPPLSVLLLLPLSGSVGVGSIDGGKMVVAEGHGGERGAAVVPRGVRTVLLLLCAETAVSIFYSFLPSLVSLSSLSLLLLSFSKILPPSFFCFQLLETPGPFLFTLVSFLLFSFPPLYIYKRTKRGAPYLCHGAG